MTRHFPMLLSSPRRRRRAARFAVVLVVAGGLAFGLAEVPSWGDDGGSVKDVWEPGKPVVVGNEKPARLTKADRHAIDATLGAFVRDGVDGRNLSAAYPLVTAGFRGGTRRAQWRNGNSPVYPYPTPVRSVSGQWRVTYSYRGDVGVALMLHSRTPRKVGPIIFQVELLKRRGGWLVDSFAPVATFTPIGVGPQHETGPADYAGSGQGSDIHAQDASLSPLWIAVPAALVALSLLVPLGFVAAARIRDRRAARAIERTLPKTLPPLPRRLDA
jgi:hypothetical protein